MLSGWKKTLILYLGQKWAPIEMNGKNYNLEHSEISQNKTPGDSKVTSSLGFRSKNLLGWYFNVVQKNKNKKNIKISIIYIENMVLFEVNKFKNTPKIKKPIKNG